MESFKKNSISFLAFYLVAFTFAEGNAAMVEEAGSTGFRRTATIKKLKRLEEVPNSINAQKEALRAAGISREDIEDAAMEASFLSDSGGESEGEPDSPGGRKQGFSHDSGGESEAEEGQSSLKKKTKSVRRKPLMDLAEKYFNSAAYREKVERKAEEAALQFGMFGVARLNAAKDPQIGFLEDPEKERKFRNRTLDVEAILFPSLQALSRSNLKEARRLLEPELEEKKKLVQKYKAGMDLEEFLREAYDLEGSGLIERIEAKRQNLIEQFKFDHAEIPEKVAAERVSLAKQLKLKVGASEQEVAEALTAQLTANLLKDLSALEGEQMATARLNGFLQEPMAGESRESVEEKSALLSQRFGRLQSTMGSLYDSMYEALSDEGRKAISKGEKVYDAFVNSKKFQAAKAWFRPAAATEEAKRFRKKLLENLKVLRESTDGGAQVRALQELRSLGLSDSLFEELKNVTKTPNLESRVDEVIKEMSLAERAAILNAFRKTKEKFVENLKVLRESAEESEERKQAKKALKKLGVNSQVISELGNTQKTPDLEKGVNKVLSYLRRENKRLGMMKEIFKEHGRDRGSQTIREEAQVEMKEALAKLDKTIETYKEERHHFEASTKKS